jgi:hypothetical protein
MIDKQAICHEAGHTVAALHLGFRVEKIELHQGFPRTVMNLDCGQLAVEQKLIVLAAGIAAEQAVFGDYNHKACGIDQEMISERRGGAISDYLLEASRIVHLHEPCLQRLRVRLMERWLEEEGPYTFDPSPRSPSFELLSHDDIKSIWAEKPFGHVRPI